MIVMTKSFKNSGLHLVGRGETRDEAKAKLQEKILAFRMHPSFFFKRDDRMLNKQEEPMSLYTPINEEEQDNVLKILKEKQEELKKKNA